MSTSTKCGRERGFVEAEMLVAFADLAGFARAAADAVSWPDLVQTMDGYFELVGERVEAAGGTLVKCIGDAALLAFPVAAADAGVRALVDLKADGDRWLAEHGLPCRQVIKAHVGTVVCGPVGPRSAKRWDVYGSPVNTVALLRATGLAITPEAFRKLQPATRRFFRKHTPPVTYIGLDDHRPAAV